MARLKEVEIIFIHMTMNSTYLQRKCPQCSTENLKSKGDVAPKIEASSLPFEELSQYWWGFRKDNLFFDYTRCGKCGQLYCDQYFTSGQLAMLYDQMPDNTDGVDKAVLAKTQKSYIDFLFRYKKPGKVYPEVGPDLGQSAEAAIKIGMASKSPIQKLMFVEPNTAAHHVLSRFSTTTETVIASEISQLETDAQINGIVMIHVLDHLLQPSEYMEQLHKLSDVDCQILIVVHDESCLLRKILGRRFPPFTLQHPHLFNRGTLRNFLEINGFRVLNIKKTRNYFPINHLVETLFTLVGVNKKYAKLFPKWNVPLRLGNIMAVAEKVV